MTALPHYPGLLQRERALLFELMGMTVAGGQTGTGLMPLARLDGGGLWKATMNDVAIVTAGHVRVWRALAAICDGGVQPLIVPMCDKRQFPAPLVNGALRYSNADVPHSDGAPFDDLSEYASDVVNATLAAAGLRATAITIDLAAGGALQGGEHFSIDHDGLRWRLYRIRTAVDNGDGTWDCTIRPPLRAPVNAGTALQFDHPKCVMRLASPDAMDLSLDLRKFGRPSVTFIEAFPPFPT
jgi:hypothetical protein